MADKLREATNKRKAKEAARKTTTRKSKTTTKSQSPKETASKAASSLADKVAGAVETSGNVSKGTSQNGKAAKGNTGSTVPGLNTYAPGDINGKMPSFDPSKYSITDPLKPSKDLPQVTEQEFEQNSTIYAGTQRALKLTGMAMDTVKERFTVEGKRADAFGVGIKTATKFERVRGDYLDYQNQLETNSQKETTLRVSQHRTTTIDSQADYDIESLDEQLEQARIAADLAKEKTRQKQNALTEFTKSLGEVATTKK